MSFRATVLTLYPEMFPGALGLSLAGRAMEAGKWSLEAVQIRDFAADRHRTVDDRPAGGGAGMVMRADILAGAIDSASPAGDPRPRLLMSPRGRPLRQERVRELAAGPGAVILCGRFEGVDQRVIEARQLEEVSIGDYILSGGEPAALVLLDAVVRLLPGVMGNEASGAEESFEDGLLEHPHYTRPQDFEGLPIPEILTSGNHSKIKDWRQLESLKLTRDRRPDLLWERYVESTGAALRIFGEDLNPDEITKLLGHPPSDSRRNGDLNKYTKLARTGAWILDSGIVEGDHLEGQILGLLDKLTDNRSVWNDLHKRFKIDVFCFYSCGGKMALTFSSRLIDQLASRGLKMDIDVYRA